MPISAGEAPGSLQIELINGEMIWGSGVDVIVGVEVGVWVGVEVVVVVADGSGVGVWVFVAIACVFAVEEGRMVGAGVVVQAASNITQVISLNRRNWSLFFISKSSLGEMKSSTDRFTNYRLSHPMISKFGLGTSTRCRVSKFSKICSVK